MRLSSLTDGEWWMQLAWRACGIVGAFVLVGYFFQPTRCEVHVRVIEDDHTPRIVVRERMLHYFGSESEYTFVNGEWVAERGPDLIQSECWADVDADFVYEDGGGEGDRLFSH